MQTPLDAHVLFPATFDNSEPKPQYSHSVELLIRIEHFAVTSSKFGQSSGCNLLSPFCG